MNENLQKIQDIFRDVLDDETLVVNETFSPSTYADWDSVVMIQIVLGIESEFGVKFTANEVANIKSVSDLLKKIA